MTPRNVPNTGIRVSPICLGTMTFGNPVAERDAIRIVHWALDHAINFIDTADMYEGYDRYLGSPGGVSERILGKALIDRRDRAVITTKVGNPIGDGRYKGSGLGRAHIIRQIDASLIRLRTDHVEFYLLHRPDPDTPLVESMGVMGELIKLGKIRHWGFSNFEVSQIWEMLELSESQGLPRPVICQPPYSWLKRDVEADVLPFCRDHAIAVTPYQPLEGGLLTGKYRRGKPLPKDSRAAENPKWLSVDADVYDRLDAFEHEAHQANLTCAQYAIRWLLDQAGITSVVAGVKRIEQLADLLAGCR